MSSHTAYMTPHPNHNPTTWNHTENDEIIQDAQDTLKNEHAFPHSTLLHQKATTACSNLTVKGLGTNITTDTQYSKKPMNKINGGRALRQSQPGESLTIVGENFARLLWVHTAKRISDAK